MFADRASATMAACGFVERRTRAATITFWFGLARSSKRPGHSTDLEVIADGYVSVTPLTFRPDARPVAGSPPRTRFRLTFRRRVADLSTS